MAAAAPSNHRLRKRQHGSVQPPSDGCVPDPLPGTVRSSIHGPRSGLGQEGREGRTGGKKKVAHPARIHLSAYPGRASKMKSNCTPNLKNRACRML
jgi:hypothetical protein